MDKKLRDLKDEFSATWQKLNLDHKLEEKSNLEQAVSQPDLWKNPDKARETTEQLSHLENELHAWLMLKSQLEDLSELITLGGEELKSEIEVQLAACEDTLNNLKKALKFTGEYDNNDAILRITAGAGGVEAMDWASMLERMYLRFAENHHFKTELIERTAGEEAGIKTAVYEVKGPNAYGLLKSEHGTHRLVRLSPFNADHLRQTSFALVEILPVIKPDDNVDIDEKDLRIDVYHSGGHGGQSVNTTNSAVRITHLPTNTVVTVQNERSQLQNKQKAMEILTGKLIKLKQEQHAESLNDLRAGESASWGQQIRNYVLQPYKLVKDTRTKHESKDPDKILDGAIDEFIDAYLENQLA
jgi:peptide chain release factor 2